MLSTQTDRQVIPDGTSGLGTQLLFTLPLGSSGTFNDNPNAIVNGTYIAPSNGTYTFKSIITFTIVDLGPGSIIDLQVTVVINGKFPSTGDTGFGHVWNPHEDMSGNFVQTVPVSKTVKLALGDKVTIRVRRALSGPGVTRVLTEVNVQMGNFQGWKLY